MGEPRCFFTCRLGSTSCACACTFFRSSARPVRQCFYLLTFLLLLLILILILIFVSAWVGAVLWSCFLTSAPGCGGEVRKRSAERLGRHPARPAAVAAVFVPRTVPARMGGPLRGRCVPFVYPGVRVFPGVVPTKGR